MFEWDEEKNQSNLQKHGVSFHDTPKVFAGLCATFQDRRFDYEEDRYITLGSLEGRVVVIAHTPRGVKTRIISMRKANSREQKLYEERLAAPRRLT